ncbi:tetratricopeptide repeat (TPR)-like superfamily protein [Artemisia annua]|uniref:Tetratricopeptide repeat (TPR)-like superfamily protein n=1 Tax=Artemisia annua TaxID=35608 RepID=A0A2U1PPL9_ARTAN|nr:tetratricopeptide repeat (TPR)-like superfamily protein [Artemisia annua]
MANESAVVHDSNSPSTIFVRHCGYTSTVKIVGDINTAKFMSQEIVIDDEPEGGANALNINRILYYMLCKVLKFLPGLGYLRPVGDRYGVFDNHLPTALRKFSFDRHLSLQNMKKIVS